MFEFFRDLEKKKAFNKALKEVKEEDNSFVSVSSKQTKETQISRVYESSAVEQIYPMSRFKNIVNQPETTAVDLKNFRDWRNAEKVKNETDIKTTRSIFDDDDEDEGEQPIIDFPNPVSKPERTPSKTNVSDLLSKIHSSTQKQRDTERNSRVQNLHDLLEKIAPATTTTLDKNVEEQKVTTSIFDEPIIEEHIIEDPVIETPIVEELPEEKITVEVIDFDNKQPKTKKVTNRKPRGKSKKRFDADVISSVDWK